MQGNVTPTRKRRRGTEGLFVRHSRRCASVSGGKCNCLPSYQAQVVIPKKWTGGTQGQKIRRTFSGPGAKAAAKQWRADALSELGKGTLVAPTNVTVGELAALWIEGATAEPPTVRRKNGEPFKPSYIRTIRDDLRLHVLPDWSARRLSDISRPDVQAWADELVGRGLSASKVAGAVGSLRVLMRLAVRRNILARNPVSEIDVPASTGRRERAASPAEAVELLAALPESIRLVYGMAFYSGLRRGELRGLKWGDLDFARGEIRVQRAYDDVAGVILPKSKKGTRRVPMLGVLRDQLLERKMQIEPQLDDWVFPGRRGGPFEPSTVRRAAATAWAKANAKRAEEEKPLLVPIQLHEARHTCVSIFAAGGIPLERIGDYVGHSSVWMTETYRHLLQGQREADRRQLDDYLARADTAARIAALDG